MPPPHFSGETSICPPESSLAAQAARYQPSWTFPQVRPGLGGGFPVSTVDLRSECGWVLEGWEMS